jgi:hypothetical protein
LTTFVELESAIRSAKPRLWKKNAISVGERRVKRLMAG